MMSRLIDFAKIEATGNDFIVIDKKKNNIKEVSVENIKKMCDRHKGIGADGIVLVLYGENQAIKMRYFNADGSLGEMCGNALRATVLFSHLLGKIRIKSWCKIEADDGEHTVYMDSVDEIQVEIKVENSLEDVSAEDIDLNNDFQTISYINTGVPHLVLNTTSDIDKIDVIKQGRSLRWHKKFQPAGTNVNFVKVINDNRLQIRTYERGVENETLSCGTGIIASTIAYWQKTGKKRSKVSVSTLGGQLNVFYQDEKLFLKGPARLAFIGQYLYV